MKNQNLMKIRIVFFGYRSSLDKAIEKVYDLRFYEKCEKQGSGCEPESLRARPKKESSRSKVWIVVLTFSLATGPSLGKAIQKVHMIF